ncbi:hypothetical protein VB145_06705 [Xanthomonas arboricola]|uniref:hypothetical protein n=1 Tax=Xanthomonas arboricola TaxID=56448 RepID=UPI00201A061B|nr:hypothetical protein [Xanthomonas arboricola]MEA5148126.1 hypothetical protein [Xanthomonas arboricola]UQP97906.1 hypothetical protein KP728_20850 [Xanthomonas arboricola pv. juglandis]UQQ00976.1 hypothetical protein KP727_14000 [Xanthomonas arboricola pv. juglandis]CAD7380060.1 hypothetical protein X12_001765 [Xanthomonas arboricola]
MWSLQGALAVLMLLAVWAILAAPLLWMASRIALRLRKGASTSPHRAQWSSIGFAAAVTLLVAPVPTPIISVFLPHVIALLDASYYARIFQGPPMMRQLLVWIAVSMALTFALSYVWLRRVLRPNAAAPLQTPTR